jgi:hypothetical protein
MTKAYLEYLDALKEFRRTHKGRNPNVFEDKKIKEALADRR